MLHVRSRPFRLPRALPGQRALPILRNWLATSDQGLLRLQLAARGTLAVFLTTIVAVLLGNRFHFNPVECANGITLGLIAPFIMREPTRRQRQRTLLLLVPPAIAATVATTLLHGYGTIGDSFFLVLVFVCFLLGPLNPRAIGMGLIAVITTYVGLYLELPPATLPLQIAAQLAAIPIVALACFVMVPMNAAATLRRSLATVQTRAAQVIQQAETLDDAPDAAQAGPRLRRAVLLLNQAALVADDQLAFFQPGAAGTIRSRLVDVELWTARLAHALQTEHPDRRGTARLRLHARRIARGGHYSTAPDQYAPGTLIALLVGLGQSVHALGQTIGLGQASDQTIGLGQASNQTIGRGEHRAIQPTPPPPARPGPLAWRLAARVTLAAGLAMAGGMALSPQRWFWAVITVYVVFLNVRSRGETIYKGIQRLAGTLLGIGSGLVIALAFTGDGTLETITILVSVFGMYYFFLTSYTLGIFFLTVMLGLLYGMLGAPVETVLLLRLEETAIGAAAAIFVAAFVFPDSTTKRVRAAGQAVLAALATALQASAQAQAQSQIPNATAAATPTAAMRQVDRMLADLRLALAPLTATRALRRRTAIERPVSALLDCVHWTRVVTAEATRDAKVGATLDGPTLTHLADRLQALARPNPTDPIDPAPLPLETPTTPLAQLARAITTLEERRSLTAYEAYVIDT